MKTLRLLLVFLAAVPQTFSQTAASVEGAILDPAGHRIPDAGIRLVDINTAAARSTRSTDGGSFQFPNVPPGRYRLEVSKTGFKSLVREPVHVLVATPLHLDLGLQVGDVVERVTVTEAAAPGINTVDASRGNAIEEAEIKRLPFTARNPVNLLTLQPGVIFTGITDTDLLFMGSTRSLDPREGVVNGVRGNQSNLTVDGADANDWENQAAFTSALPITLDSLQEFRVTTTNANSTDGGAGGAQVTLVTKSGSNQIHGNARWYHRNTATAANSFFNNRIGLPTPKLLRNIGGVSLGGPIRKNRLFLFGDFEMRRDASESTELRSVPSEALKQGLIRYRTTVNTIASITPEQFRSFDPTGAGENQAVLRYLSQFPLSNETTSGDGLNLVGYRFNAPIGVNNKLYTARVDYKITSDGRNSVFWRGTLGDIAADQTAATYPGQPVASKLVNNSRGFVAGYTAQLGANKVNSFRWGFTRQSIENSGVAAARFNLFSSITTNMSDPLTAFNPLGRKVPVHEIKDEFSWTHGRHVVQAGGSVRLTRDNRYNFTNAFPVYRSFSGDCNGSCRDIANALLNDNDPTNNPSILGQVADNTANLAGLITNVSATYLADPHAQSILPQGTGRVRNFAENGFELYFQDAWRIRPNLLVTAGIRYSYFSPIWEVNGAQVGGGADVQDYWNTLQANMAAGKPADAMAPLTWVLAGKANGKPGWYTPDRNNFAPRFAAAWTAAPKTVVRAGFGVYYNRLGGALTAREDDYGSPGVSSTLNTPTAQATLANAIRFSGTCGPSGCTGLPPIGAFLTAPTSAQFPYTPPISGRGTGFLVDNHLHAPYSMNTSLSIQRELSKSIVVDVGYVGVLGRQLLAKLDLAQFHGDLRDPQSRQTFWQAQNAIANLIGPNYASPAIDYRDLNAVRRIAPIPFFENLMSNLPAFTNNPTLSATQAFYVFQAARVPDWARTTPPLDVNLAPGRSPWSRAIDPEQDGWVISQRQFQSLGTWANPGSSNFHSLQLSLRKNAGSALFGFNYVLSKSIDNSSQPENLGSDITDLLPNSFATGAGRSISAFDIRHNLNAHWVWDVPLARGHGYLGNWTVTGVARWYSGLPVRLANALGRATSVQLGGPGTAIRPMHFDIVRNGPDGFPNAFRDSTDAYNSAGSTIPGGVGTAFPFYGPSFSTIDLGLNKRFPLPWREAHSIEFRTTAYNALNRANFNYGQASAGSPTGFGRIQATVGPRGGARELEFALRYEF